MRTGKAGRLPGCQVRDKVHAAHLVSDVGLAAHEVGRVRAALSAPDSGLVVPGKAGVMALSAPVLARVSIGASPMNSWRCALRLRRWPGSSLSPAGARSRTRNVCHNCAPYLIARARNSLT